MLFLGVMATWPRQQGLNFLTKARSLDLTKQRSAAQWLALSMV